MIDKLDKIEERINHFFTKGKNANERCFDFFLRSLTFFIILLFVLLYGTLANADESYTTLGVEGLSTEVFVSSELESWLAEQDLTTSDLTTVGIASGVQSYPFTVSDLANLKIPSSITYNGNTYTPEQYNIFLTRGNVSDHGISYLTCYCIVGENLVVGNGGLTVYNFESSGIGIFACAINPNNLNEMWNGNPSYTQTTNGINNDTNGFDDNITYQYFNIQTPVYYASNQFYTLLNDNTVNSNVRTDFSYQYVHYPDNVFQLNYHYAIEHPVEPDSPITESNLNNMALNNFDIYLSGSNQSIDITQSNVIFSVDCNDWILKHSSDYALSVTYGFIFKLDIDGNLQEYQGQFQQQLPISTFTEGFSVNVGELMARTKFKGMDMRTGYEYLRDNYHLYVKSKPQENQTVHINGVKEDLDMLDKFVYQVLVTGFDVSTDNDTEHSVIVKDAKLVTKSVLKSINNGVGSSGSYVKTFDFLRGTSFVSDSDILVNKNPFDGFENTSSGSGSTNANGGVVQNNNQTVNINLNNNVSNITGGVSDEDSDNTVRNMKKVFDEFKNGLGVINESSMDSEGNPNGFLSLLSHTYEFIPGMNYIKTAIAVIVALAVILFILKVLLF